MKPPLLNLLFFSFMIFSPLACLDREKPLSSPSTSDQKEDSPLEKEDKELLLIFSSIVSCFANILKDPHNPQILALNLGGIATGVINMLLNTLECKSCPELKGRVEQLQKITRSFKPETIDQKHS